MKLLFCPQCRDVIRLIKKERSCLCGEVRGYYLEDGLNAVYYGPAIPVGFDNSSFQVAVNKWKNSPNGTNTDFDAFVFPKSVLTLTPGE